FFFFPLPPQTRDNRSGIPHHGRTLPFLPLAICFFKKKKDPPAPGVFRARHRILTLVLCRFLGQSALDWSRHDQQSHGDQSHSSQTAAQRASDSTVIVRRRFHPPAPSKEATLVRSSAFRRGFSSLSP